jgi:hypothetical protein
MRSEREFINNGMKFIANAKADNVGEYFPRHAITKPQGRVDGSPQVGIGRLSYSPLSWASISADAIELDPQHGTLSPFPANPVVESGAVTTLMGSPRPPHLQFLDNIKSNKYFL